MPREDQIITAKSDKPIVKCDEDIFGWKDHARMLAKLITHESNDDVALGISAPWGSGKTSMLNLIKEQINEIGIEPKPIIVEFDPWFYGSEEKVIHSFFETLAKAIFKENHPIREAISKIMGYLSKILTKTPDLPSTFTPNPLVTEAINFAKQFLGILTDDLKDWIGHGSLNSFGDVKKLLILLLSEAQRKKELPQIIIMIDDLDRLQADEALTMLKIIRLVADLPCIRSIVAFDEEATGQLISNKFNIDGISYIRKMINVPIYLPHISKNGLIQYFTKEIEDILIANDYEYDKKSFPPIIDKISEVVETLRCIKVILNTYKIGISAVGDYVDPVDYLVLCVFFNLTPTLFSALKKNTIFPPLGFDEFKAGFEKEKVGAKKAISYNNFNDSLGMLMGSYKIDDNVLAKIINELLSSVFKTKMNGQILSNIFDERSQKSIFWVDNHKYYFSLLQHTEFAASMRMY